MSAKAGDNGVPGLFEESLQEINNREDMSADQFRASVSSSASHIAWFPPWAGGSEGGD